MLFCLSLIAVLLYDTVFASAVCSQTFREAPGQIEAVSLLSPQLGYNQCEYVIHAPGDSYITLNFTLLHGFESQLDVHGRLCLPEVEIAEVDAHGTISVMSRICRNAPPPLVFQSKTHIIKLTYVWVAKHPSRFSLDFDFHRKYSDSSGPCEFTCVDQGCLSSWSLVCNGIPDCLDQSDERDCPLPLPSSDSPDTDDVSSIQIIIIVIAIVLTLGILTCVVSHYKMGARSWSERRHRHPQHHQQGHHHHDDPNSSTVLYVPTATHERFLHEAAVQRDRQIRLASVQLDLKLNLPPSIALPDGEEQPYGSLQHLHLRDPEQESEIYRECIRPPPNRTVFDGESPPPYRSSSVGILNPQSNSTPPPRIVRGWNGTPLVMRCHSMSTNNNTTPRNSNTSSLSHSPHLPSHHHQHNPPLPTNLRLGPGARQSVCTTDRHSVDDFHGEPPPGYSEVIANPSVYSSLHPNSGV